jgi:hypothetical protein
MASKKRHRLSRKQYALTALRLAWLLAVKYKKVRIIWHCFDVHKKEVADIKFDLLDYAEFWLSHHIGDRYEVINVNKSKFVCKVVYYPLPNFKDLRALVEVESDEGVGCDIREVPVVFLTRLERD